MNISIIGLGHVGLSLATFLSTNYNVIGYDLSTHVVNMVNSKKSPIKDTLIENYLSNKQLNFFATNDKSFAIKNAELIIISTPTDYDYELGTFNCQSVDKTISEITKLNNDATIIIKSTVPVGYTSKIRDKYNNNNIIFSPEFSREGNSLYDNLYPDRIIIGCDKTCKDKAKNFSELLIGCSIKKDIPILYMHFSEAEAVKLFANTYLALRVDYFNEIDTYADKLGLNTKNIIDGVCLDKRIGNYYNNPSFGYGGYCLPKDTKQLLRNYENIPQNLIAATIDSNNTRKSYITDKIKELISTIHPANAKINIGIYRLTMKINGDNYKNSAILDIIDNIKTLNIDILVYEPTAKDNIWDSNIHIINNLNVFKNNSDLIIANRYDDNLYDVKNKVYTRDIFNNN